MQTKSLKSTARLIFAKNLIRLRIERRFPQELLAEVANLHRTYVGSVERRERNVSIDNMESFADALNVSLREIL